MLDDYRPDPDALLAAVQKDEARQQRGKLKIFLGMAAGVGKTYAMLQAAHEMQAQNTDIVIGYVETHQRKETEALLDGLERLPLRAFAYRDTVLQEMDVDAILKRRPQIVLIDELAHRNVEGSRHPKRYQDVIEILEAGIDVWTALNIQHFESRVDAVKQITGITIHETVPDSILDLADTIELIDLSPEDLRKRLAEGKVYTAERVEVAANNFFRLGNLNALREMALRLTAEHVDHQLDDYMKLKHIVGPWKSGERLMVAVGTSPFSEQLIRWTRRMAYNLSASWLGVYVETPQDINAEAQSRLRQNFDLVKELGGEIVTVTGGNIAESLLRIAHQRNVTQIVVGKPRRPAHRLTKQLNLVDDLIKANTDIDIYVVNGDKADAEARKTPRFYQTPISSTSQQYGIALGIVALVTAIDLFLISSIPWLGYQAVGLTELLAVLLIAVYLGRGPALLAATVSAFSWNFLFIEPRFTFVISEPQDIILVFLYFLIALFTGNLTARIRRQEQLARRHAEQSSTLYALAQTSLKANSLDELLQAALEQVKHLFNVDTVLILADSKGLAAHSHPSSGFSLDEKEYSVALWAYQHRKQAGRFTDTLPSAQAQYFPLLTANRTFGVIGIRSKESSIFSFDQQLFLEMFITQIGLVLEHQLLDEAAAQAAMLQESERLYTTLLNSISHELRTPLATITGASSGLLDPITSVNEQTRQELAEDIHSAAERLNRLVENLLDMSRLESGRLYLKLDWVDIGDIIASAIHRLQATLGERPIRLDLAPSLPILWADAVLLEQVLVILLDNACRYTPAGTALEIEAKAVDKTILILLEDTGEGIPEADHSRIFDKFYRLAGSPTGGTGLGLSIARGIVEAHQGQIWVENSPKGGARFLIRLPITQTPSPVQEARL